MKKPDYQLGKLSAFVKGDLGDAFDVFWGWRVLS